MPPENPVPEGLSHLTPAALVGWLTNSGAMMAVLLLGCTVYLFFVLAGTALVRSRRRRLRELVRQGRHGCALARTILRRADTHIIVTQVGVFLGAVSIGAVMAVEASSLLWQTPLDHWSLLVGFCLRWSLLLLAILVVTQTARALAFTQPEETLCSLARPLSFCHALASPLVFILDRIIGRALHAFGLAAPEDQETEVSAEEITEMVEIGRESGEIEKDEQELIQRVFLMSDTVVREVMTPRADIVSVSIQASLDEVRAIFAREGLSRIVVVGVTLDEVKGVLIAKDLIPFVGVSAQDFSLAKLVRKPYLVPNTKKVDDLLADMKRLGVHFAVVLDEHGGVDGVVTVEDLIEELVGEIFDEYDTPADEVEVQRTKTGDLLVDGGADLEALNQEHRFNFPLGSYDTIAGCVIHHLGHIPVVGEVFDFSGVRIRIEEMNQNRVVALRISRKKLNKSKDLPGRSGPAAVAPIRGDAGAASSESAIAPKKDIVADS